MLLLLVYQVSGIRYQVSGIRYQVSGQALIQYNCAHRHVWDFFESFVQIPTSSKISHPHHKQHFNWERTQSDIS